MNVRVLLVFCFLLISTISFAQVGIGTTSPNAQLEIDSSNQATPANTDGILIPKVDTFPAINPTALQQGMLVYLTTATTFLSIARTPGFYYWDYPTLNWIVIQTSTNANWNILGNGSTSATTNFLGTIDDTDFVLKRNNIRAGYIGDPAYYPGFNFNNGNTAFGANSMKNPTINFASQFGVRNTAFGVNVMPVLSTGELNTGIGEFALFSLTTGVGNTGIGSGALYTNSSASSNVAVGRNALTSSNSSFNTGVGFAALRNTTSGGDNTSLGYNSGYHNTTGGNNTFLGYNSGFTNTSGGDNTSIGVGSGFSNSLGSNNVFLGYQAGFNETGNSKLYIEISTLAGGTDSSQYNALIYGDFGSTPKIVRANAQLQVGNPALAGTGYAFPTTRGTANQILQNDGVGGTSWVDTVNNISIIRTNLSANQSFSSSASWQKINFNTIVFDTKSEFNTGTYRFVATKSGYYEINAGYHSTIQTDENYYGIAVYKNGSEYQETSTSNNNNVISRTINCIISMNATDYIEIYLLCPTTGCTVDSYSGKTYFEVKQLK